MGFERHFNQITKKKQNIDKISKSKSAVDVDILNPAKTQRKQSRTASMSDSPGDNLHHRHEEEGQKMTIQNRLCDFCGDSMALLYCRADSAKLCLSCDREVHSTNQLFTKHTRSRLCDVCDASPASILCSTDNLVLCQNCDWAKHGRSLSSAHDRRPLEGFSGQPSVTELLAFVGFEDLGKKSLFCGDESEVNEFLGCGVYESVGVDEEFSDFLVWDTPAVVNLDDLIVSTACDHNFQAMGVPPLPKVSAQLFISVSHPDWLLRKQKNGTFFIY